MPVPECLFVLLLHVPSCTFAGIIIIATFMGWQLSFATWHQAAYTDRVKLDTPN